MLIPRFSIKWILILTTVLGVFFVVVRKASDNETWAIAVSAAAVLAVVIFCLYAVAFGLAYGAAKLSRTLTPESRNQNPFVVEGQYPPQAVPKNPVADEA